MKKALYIILLIAELVLGFGFLTLVTSVTGWTYFLIVTAVWAVLTVLVLVKLKKAVDAGAKRKMKIRLALVMLLPIVAGLAGMGWFIFAMTSAGLV